VELRSDEKIPFLGDDRLWQGNALPANSRIAARTHCSLAFQTKGVCETHQEKNDAMLHSPSHTNPFFCSSVLP
jgi:hypothetical protein